MNTCSQKKEKERKMRERETWTYTRHGDICAIRHRNAALFCLFALYGWFSAFLDGRESRLFTGSIQRRTPNCGSLCLSLRFTKLYSIGRTVMLFFLFVLKIITVVTHFAVVVVERGLQKKALVISLFAPFPFFLRSLSLLSCSFSTPLDC